MRVFFAFFVCVFLSSFLYALPSEGGEVLLLPPVRIVGDTPNLRIASSSDHESITGEALRLTGARSLDEALDDLAMVCRQNGGVLQ